MSDNEGKLRTVLRQITHPDEGPCPICSHIFDAHIEGCPYEAIDDALADQHGEKPPPKRWRCKGCGETGIVEGNLNDDLTEHISYDEHPFGDWCGPVVESND